MNREGEMLVVETDRQVFEHVERAGGAAMDSYARIARVVDVCAANRTIDSTPHGVAVRLEGSPVILRIDTSNGI